MKIFRKMKDGGQDSNVTGFFLIEIKSLFSIVLLRFDPGSREAYHSHAFNAVSYVFGRRPGLFEWFEGEVEGAEVESGWLEKGWHWTPRQRCHMVYNYAERPIWALSFRGPWADRWREVVPATGEAYELTHGRKRVTQGKLI